MAHKADVCYLEDTEARTASQALPAMNLGLCLPPGMSQTRKLVVHQQVTVEVGWQTAPPSLHHEGGVLTAYTWHSHHGQGCPLVWMGPLERWPGALGFGCPHKVLALVFFTVAMQMVDVHLSGTRSRYSCSGWATGLRERWQLQ